MHLIAEEDFIIRKENENKDAFYGRLDKIKAVAHAIPNPSAKATYFGKTEWPSMKI